MFHSRRVNNKINHLHERSLRIVYKDNYSSYADLLAKDKKETFSPLLSNYRTNLSNVIIHNILKTRTLTYNLRSQTNFVRDCVNTRRCGLNSRSYFAPKISDMVPSEIKNVNCLQKFKTEIRKWAPENSSCYLCRTYMQNLVFVDLVYF